MTVPTALTGPRRQVRLRYLGGVAALLSVAVLVAPFPLASAWPGGGYRDVGALREAVTTGFVHFWSAGDGDVGTELARATDFWARFHIVKAALAGVLLLVLAVLGARAWRVFAHAASRRRRLGAALVGVGTAPLTVLALLVVVANLQGAVAPLSSVLGFLPLGGPHGHLARTVGEVRHSLASSAHAPARDLLVHDFTSYHVAMAFLGGLVTVGLVVAAALLWRRRARVPADDRRWRLVLAVGVLAIGALGAIFGVVTAANVSTALHPVPALLAFFEGGL